MPCYSITKFSLGIRNFKSEEWSIFQKDAFGSSMEYRLKEEKLGRKHPYYVTVIFKARVDECLRGEKSTKTDNNNKKKK